MRWFAASVCVLLQLSIRTAYTQGCTYFYSEQPPERLSCNPYLGGELRLECTAHGPLNAAFDVAWFRRTLATVTAPAHPGGASQKAAGVEVLGSGSSNGTSILFQRRLQEARRTIRSQLRVRLQNGSVPELGSYCCSVVAATIRGEVAASDVLILEGAEAYEGLPSCSTRAQSKYEQKCAVPPRPQPAATVPPGPSSLQLTPLDSSAQSAATWQAMPSNQLSSSVGVNAVSPTGPSMEGGPRLFVIVLSAFAGIACAAALLCVSSCVCLHHRRRKVKGRTFASAINHTYTNTSSHCEWGLHSGSGALYHGTRPGGVYTTAGPSPSSSSSLSCATSAGGLSNDHYVEMSASLDWRRRMRDQETGTASSPVQSRGGPCTGAQHPHKDSVSECVALVGDGWEEEDGRPHGVLPDPDSEYVNVACQWPATPCWIPPPDMESRPHPDMTWRPQQLHGHPRYPPSRIHRQYSTCSYDGMYVMPGPRPPSPDPHHASSGHHYEEIIDTVVNLAYLKPHSVVMERNPSYKQGLVIAAGNKNTPHTATTTPPPPTGPDREPGKEPERSVV